MSIGITVLVCALAGCASKSIQSDFSLEAAKTEGIVILSVSHDLSGGRGAKAIFYLNGGSLAKNGGTLFSLPEVFPGIPGGSDFEDEYGKVFALSLPAGHHRINSWQIVNGTGLRIFPKETPDQLVFEVTAGEIKYLGNLHANLQIGRNIFGMTIVGNGFPEVRDQRTRDIGLFERKYPQFKDKAVIELLNLGPWITEEGTRRQIDLHVPVNSRPLK